MGRHRVGRRVSVQVKLRVEFALRRQGAVELVQQSSLELTGFDLEFGARGSIDDANRYAGVTDPVTQLRGEVPLDLLAAEILDTRQDAFDQDFGAQLGEQRRPLRDPVTRVAFA